MVLPTVIVLGVLVMYPLVQGVFQSFTDLNESNSAATSSAPRPSAAARSARPTRTAPSSSASTTTSTCSPAQRGDFWLQFVNTLVWTVACVAFHYGLGLGLAVMLNRRMRGP